MVEMATFCRIHTLGRGRFQLDQISEQSLEVALQGIRFEIHLANRAVNNACLVGAVTHLAGLRIFHCCFDVCRYRAHFRVGHQAARTQQLAQLTDDAHRVRRGDHDVKGHVSTLDLIVQIIHAYYISACGFSLFCVFTLGKYRNTDLLAGSVGQYGRTTNILV